MSLNIGNQTLNGPGKITNIGYGEFNHYDDMLEYYFKKEILENKKLEGFYKIITCLLNREKLKLRFGIHGIHSKYAELAKQASLIVENGSTGQLVSSDNLDDGYKSIISIILNIALLFERMDDSNYDSLCLHSTELLAKIRSVSLNLEFSNEIQSYKQYSKAKKNAENIKRKILPYLQCAEAYGNFLNFSNVYIEPLENRGFVDKEVKFSVSTNIIPRLIKPLYGESPESGLREIIQNACDACKQSKDKAVVELFLDQIDGKWRLTVRDYGVGMDEHILTNKYFVIGESTKKNAHENLVGQFGIGALASFLLGESIEVKTKRIGQENVLSFIYHYKTDDEDNGNIDNQDVEIKRCKDDTFRNGTEVKINLNNELSKLTLNNLEKKLKINEWYLLLDIEMRYWVNGDQKKIDSLNTENFIWKPVISTDGFTVNYLFKNKKDQNDRSGVGKIIYNGILIPENYLLNSKCIKYAPCVQIIDMKKNIMLDLSRSKVLNQDIFNSEVEEDIYSFCVEELKSNFELKQKILKDNCIVNFSYSNRFIIKVPLFFCREGFGIYSTASINKLKREGKYKTVIKVFRCFGSKKININQLSEDCLYVFDYSELSKPYISELILASGETVIPPDVLSRYFYDADNSNNGFKKETIQYIYSALKKPLQVKDTAKAVWDYHNENKKTIFGDLLQSYNLIKLSEYDTSYFELSLKHVYETYERCIVKITDINHISYSDPEIIEGNLDVKIIS